MNKKNILIVGGSSGLGFELLIKYQKEGHNVFVITKDIKKLKKKLLNLKIFKNINYMQIDLQKKNKIKLIINKVLVYFKNKVDLVIHIAGGGLGIKSIDVDYNDLIKVLNLNILSLIEINKYLIPQMMKKKKGTIIHLSSIASYESVGSISYNISKSALNAYVKTMGRHLAEHNVVLTGIALGGFIAKDNAMYRFKNKNLSSYKNFIKKRLPRKKMGTTGEIIPLIDFLGSEFSGMMSGSIVLADGAESKFFQQ